MFLLSVSTDRHYRLLFFFRMHIALRIMTGSFIDGIEDNITEHFHPLSIMAEGTKGNNAGKQIIPVVKDGEK